MVLKQTCMLAHASTLGRATSGDLQLAGMQEAGGKMAWTIIRPGGLKSNAPTGMGVLTEDTAICGAINREDVAELVVKAIFSEKANGKVGAQSFSPRGQQWMLQSLCACTTHTGRAVASGVGYLRRCCPPWTRSSCMAAPSSRPSICDRL